MVRFQVLMILRRLFVTVDEDGYLAARLEESGKDE